MAASPDDPEFTVGKRFTDTNKVVFTKTLDQSEWDNTVLAEGDLVDEISRLEKQNGKDIITYGGSSFVSALNKCDLIDEFHLFGNHVALGTGMAIFKELHSTRKFVLDTSIAF